MIYVDFDFYANSYFGRTISEEDFPRLALLASQYIDYITIGKAEARADLEAVKMCCCAMAEQYQSIETARELAQKSITACAADNAEVSSETVGSWSRSYRSCGEIAQAAAQISAQTEETGKSVLRGIAMQYLAHTGLLYRGGRCCR